ncbi:hypothetical protein B0A50_04835 [Salinomyces thailandicus]|uniref:G-patch domain-containing protein n=1 Tax=Salinomyces thailandicus TaxID=706561 RepID=A0A4U0TZA1_9PEZI|nr:hypothetical protein B0A50_04835 [Salinomyces thailandica]
MGLSGNKKKTKLSTDPNNNNWAKSTTNYGHRILASQGWKPGDYLGASNAAHADHYTAANASHIKVALREDGLGLGAKIGGKSNAETFGLSTLSGIFGRLNGKSEEEVQRKQEDLRDAELRSYQAVRHGVMNFVRGGLLVGDRIEDVPVKGVGAGTGAGKPAAVPAVAVEGDAGKKRKAGDGEEKVSKSKKRKSSDRGEDQAADTTSDEKADSVKHIKTKKSKKPKTDAAQEETTAPEPSDPSDTSAKALRSAERRAKRLRKEQRRAAREQQQQQQSTETNDPADTKTRLKQEKRLRKEERRRRKESKRLARAEKSSSASTEASTTAATPVTSSVGGTGTSTPATVIAAQPVAFGRQAIRQRYIQQKRMASMDPKALNEILMIKAQA